MSARERGTATQALRFFVMIALDAAATACGLCIATFLTYGPGAASSAVDVRLVAPLLVTIRVASVLAARLHRWSFRGPGRLDGLRLAVAMFAATLAFALGCPTLPRPLYALELFVTTGLMFACRFGPSFADGLQGSPALPPAEHRFAASEGPRRAVNVLVALVGIALTLPLWVLIALAIKLTSRGPVFYKQERVGLDLRASRPLVEDPRRRRDLGGRPFMMYKFRTMRLDAEAGTGPVWWSGKSDPRVTLAGRILRHSRLDELPQLLNVLRGDMNVVGPRPERPSIFADLRAKIPNYAVRQRVRPGITGFAQVNLEYDASIEDVAHKLEYDLEYLSNQGVATDLAIMAKTPAVMLFREKVLARPASQGAAHALLDGKGRA